MELDEPVILNIHFSNYSIWEDSMLRNEIKTSRASEGLCRLLGIGPKPKEDEFDCIACVSETSIAEGKDSLSVIIKNSSCTLLLDYYRH